MPLWRPPYSILSSSAPGAGRKASAPVVAGGAGRKASAPMVAGGAGVGDVVVVAATPDNANPRGAIMSSSSSSSPSLSCCGSDSWAWVEK